MAIEAAIKTRLKEALKGDLRRVDGGLEFASITRKTAQNPSAFVFTVRESGRAQELIGAVRQTIKSEVAVVLAVRAIDNPTGEEALDRVNNLRGKVRRALVGFSPIGGWSALSFVRGQLLDLEAGWAFWQDTFETAGLMEEDENGEEI